MKIGFIGAGKVGCSLGKYFSTNGLSLSGYASRQDASAQEAAVFTDSNFYSQWDALVQDSDVIFITVPDEAIASVWDSLKTYPIQEKLICHCSGSLSSDIFSDIQHFSAFGYSVHPLYAIATKQNSYEDLAHAMFTIEGDAQHLGEIRSLLEGLGNQVQTIDTKQKARYHAAAVFASNHMVALAKVATDLLVSCGFSETNALEALTPLMSGNLSNILNKGPMAALTGPVERNDVATVEKHLSCLTGESKELYRELTNVLISIGQEKHPKEDYEAMKALMQSH